MPIKPTEKEERYFLQQEAERLQRLREEHLSKIAEEQRRKMKELHYLHCPKCGQKMEVEKITELEVEMCPDCGGIYLDSGELETLMNRSERGQFAEMLSIFRNLWR